jgi:threonine dehydrogenase-like Zn-dependent dehydrogenase
MRSRVWTKRRASSRAIRVSHDLLLQKIEAKSARIVVIGIGYVGLPLVAEFARAGFRTTGLDKDPEKVRLLNAGESYIADVATGDLAPYVKSRMLDASTDPAILREADAVVVLRADAAEQDQRSGTCASSWPRPKRSRAISMTACS